MSKMTFEQRSTLLQAIIATVEHLKFLHLMGQLEADGQTGDDSPFRLANGDAATNFNDAATRIIETMGQLIGVDIAIIYPVDVDDEM